MKYLNALNKIPGVGSQKIRILMDFFGNEEIIWNASSSDLSKSGIGEKLAQKIINERNSIDPALEWEKLKNENVTILDFNHENYPKTLREIPSAPYLLYVKGNVNFNRNPMIAIVGSRKLTTYGKQSAYSLARDLAQAGITVVSGMALGVDSVAHRGALDGGGKTIAVLGSSLDDKNIGPRINFNLSRQIIENGALISDYPIETPAGPGTFPARNRIMAGMTLGTVVIEATEKSGTLITSGLALDFNREVFAVPGSIFSPNSVGPNLLIRNGAKIVTSVQDVLEELNLQNIKETVEIKEMIPDSKEEEIIVKTLSTETTHIDIIIKQTKLETNVVSSTLSILEMKGFIKDMGGQNYIRLQK